MEGLLTPLDQRPKPRLIFRCGYWHCLTPPPWFGLGIGKTPYLAYLDWQYT